MTTPQPPAFANADNCYKCGCAFSLFTRKHHCRNCGRTVCGTDSPSTRPLPHFGIPEPVRVCNDCDVLIRNGGAQRAAAPKAAAPAASSSQHRPSEQQPSTFVPTPAAAPRTKNCTCGSPLCVCPPDPVEKPAASQSSTSTAQRKPVTAAQPAAASSNAAAAAAPSPFFGFGGTSKAAHVWNLSGDLNDQLREAVKAQDLAGVKQLLGAGADAQYIDRTGNTLVHLAAMFNRFDIVEALVASGASVWNKNPAGETPVDLAPPAMQRKMRELQPQA